MSCWKYSGTKYSFPAALLTTEIGGPCCLGGDAAALGGLDCGDDVLLGFLDVDDSIRIGSS